MDSQLVSSLSTRCVLLMLLNMKMENTAKMMASQQNDLPEGKKDLPFLAI